MQYVVINDVDIKFGSMVMLCFKFFFASILALMMVGIVLVVPLAIVAGLTVGAG